MLNEQTAIDDQDILPADILRLIFEFASDHKPTASSLLLVSSTARVWIEPIFYRRVILRDPDRVEQFYNTLKKRSVSLSRHVHHLSILCCKPSVAICGVLAACYALSRLTVHPSVLPMTLRLPADVTLSRTPSRFLPGPFQSVKQLRLTISPFRLSTVTELNSFDSITHIAIDFPRTVASTTGPDHALVGAFLRLIAPLLRSHSIQVVAILASCIGVRVALDTALSEIVDERLIAVELSGKDAMAVRQGRSSVWEIIDRAIECAY
ncbi:hypothetical protein SISNIDRAFT_454143 [Sistotremastrum niveocremeum HHB9708]|uniref:F-box domain-containing protein n=2 Tax=Sistotremastraceae TaxID=3402574 RepID=A0A164V162_9AGAM|nr:hypothetical protein SISNIDRAFT_454143 [Sistotremastrum niveocremeum HHB9708]KZT39949.1 hypothetical protein SISSUDRAFT_1044920 [Sistotremastrum suecicum HHB10207 ss-3]